jgi:hypothetical protein
LLGALTAGQVLVHDVVFAVPFDKINQRYPMIGRVALEPGYERLAPLHHQRRRRDLEPEVASQETDDLPDSLQLGDVDVEIQPVDRLDLEHHVAGQHISGSTR